MALPILPIAGIAMRYGAVALAGYAVMRQISPGRRDQRAEDALDDVEEGLTLRKDAGQVNTTSHFHRVIRVGTNGPGVEVDLSALGRLRIRKVK